MGNCREVAELMSLALDDATSQRELCRLDRHVSVCEHCWLIWAAMRQASDLLCHAPIIPAPPGFVRRFSQELQAREQFKVRRIRKTILLVCAGTLILSLCALGMILWGQFQAGELAVWLMGTMFVEQMSRSLFALLRGLSVPLRLLGPIPIAVFFVALLWISATSTSLWTWTVLRMGQGQRRVP